MENSGERTGFADESVTNVTHFSRSYAKRVMLIAETRKNACWLEKALNAPFTTIRLAPNPCYIPPNLKFMTQFHQKFEYTYCLPSICLTGFI